MGVGRETGRFSEGQRDASSSDPVPVQLDLLPFTPVQRSQTNNFAFPWLNEKLAVEPEGRGLEVINRRVEEGGTSAPNNKVSSFQMNFSIFRGAKRNYDGFSSTSSAINEISESVERGGTSSRGSDDMDDENGLLARKKLRLSKEQSAFLEDSFKEHNTLNPKQKVALAKQLNLRPRQVEVWFQNRRARTKLKQTEVDCEYLKRCCETLTEENKRLQKELQELRALKATQPFYKQLPATTLTMCPSCERVATTTATATATNKLAI
ncbi:hypothetical protein RD792_000320 [Penstemon davidsonii]|uniref:Homeobox domain-containing protein n=1 Tax=Penstemon davidsonii TaxID=160366 RepID=A0ABR0DKF0_9LAMI|nr:hypothetical protein RD792_000320 [Penstemon davidsonii]